MKQEEIDEIIDEATYLVLESSGATAEAGWTLRELLPEFRNKREIIADVVHKVTHKKART